MATTVSIGATTGSTTINNTTVALSNALLGVGTSSPIAALQVTRPLSLGATGKALLGDGLGILAGLFYAGYLLALTRAANRVSTVRIMAVSTTVAALALAPYAWGTAENFMPQSAHGWLILVGLALIAHVLGQSLVAYGFAHLPASFSSVSLLTQPVFAAVYAWALLGEAIGPNQLVGGAIVLLGIYLAKRGS